jgi:hypothetical protein
MCHDHQVGLSLSHFGNTKLGFESTDLTQHRLKGKWEASHKAKETRME